MIDRRQIGEHGYVEFIDIMGSEHEIAEAARVSYGEGTKSISDDTTLIRYLMRHRHTTPLEMIELKFRVQVPMDTWRQWIRHRTANVNEYSTRYSIAIDEMAPTGAGEWRLQSELNKQGSNGLVTEWPEGMVPPVYLDIENAGGIVSAEVSPGEFLSAKEHDFHKEARAIYEERLAFGVAKEQARKDLPLSTYTRAYWKIDLHNCLHFLGLRMDSHAQLEIRTYANAIGEMVAARLPNVWQAFQDYRLGAVILTRLDLEVLKQLIDGPEYKGSEALLIADTIVNKRERAECYDKMVKVDAI